MVASLMTTSVVAQISFNIKGKVAPGISATRVALGYGEDGSEHDTVSIVNGLFEFKGKARRSALVVLDLISPQAAGSSENEEGPVAFFYLDQGVTSVEFDKDGKSKITGGKEQKIYAEYSSRKQDPKNFGMDTEEDIAKLIKKYPDSYVGFDKLSYHSVRMKPKNVQQVFGSLSKRIKNTVDGIEFRKTLDIALRFDIGKPSVDFSLPDTSGKAISLASFKGTYVLLDFWASWCGPCRATHPELKKTYSKFKDKNFRILAVSLDRQKSPWLKAIEEDQLTWALVLDASGDVARNYGIKQIPQSLLLDPDGKIVGRNLKGEALDAALSKLLK
ncbi:hypothetical protein BFS30_20525 [Pedobacter steynii]|uniref:Thioredoxin domain-containing protein n=2 Tax=Pedobacter steynii TaxID=430522 RepID=A0A1D7QL62_9SPHI|nr:hypothetical protein BFS30_20525 [Pedobacter steynii]